MTTRDDCKHQKQTARRFLDEPFLFGGSGEIRTHGRLTPTSVFKTDAFNRSATDPFLFQAIFYQLASGLGERGRLGPVGLRRNGLPPALCGRGAKGLPSAPTGRLAPW